LEHKDNSMQLLKVAEALERKTIALIQEKNWSALEEMLAPECQFVTVKSVYGKSEAMRLMKEMHLASVTLKDFSAQAVGDNLVVTFQMACAEHIAGEPQSHDFSPRLSVWKQCGERYMCIAYADMNRP
jgi:hypothetical protein